MAVCVTEMSGSNNEFTIVPQVLLICSTSEAMALHQTLQEVYGCFYR